MSEVTSRSVAVARASCLFTRDTTHEARHCPGSAACGGYAVCSVTGTHIAACLSREVGGRCTRGHVQRGAPSSEAGHGSYRVG